MSNYISGPRRVDAWYSGYVISRHPIVRITGIYIEITKGVLTKVPTVPPMAPAMKLFVNSACFVVALGNFERTEWIHPKYPAFHHICLPHEPAARK
jgi:hypothetical protein